MKQRFSLRYSRRAAFRSAVKALTFSGLAAGAMIGLSPFAHANLENFWSGSSGDFSDPTMWSLGRVPITPAPDGSGADNADVFNGGTVMITTDGLMPNDVNAGGSNNGTTGDGTYMQTGGSISIGTGGGWLRLGTQYNTTGTYNLQGGTLSFVGGDVNVGERPGANGFLNISGGVFDHTTNTNRISVGGTSPNVEPAGGSTGTLSLSGSGVINDNGQLWIGENTNGNGTFNMSGGTLNQHNWLAIGRESATGTWNMSGGTVIKDGAADNASHIVLAGLGTTQTATVNQSGGDVIVASGGRSVWIGETATAVWNISGGTLQASEGIELGVNDPASNGTLTILPPSTPGGVGAVVTSPTVTVGSNNFTSATVNLNGGTLATGGFVVGGGTGTRTINFNGGTVQVTAPSADFLSGNSISSVVQAGGAIFDTNGNDTSIATSLTSGGGTDGGLTKRGNGMLTLTGANTYNGPTTVSAGALTVNGSIGSGGSAGAVTVAQGATLSGSGSLNLAANSVTINGILAPGSSPQAGTIGTLTMTTTGTLTLASTAVTQFDLNSTLSKDLLMAGGAKLVIQGGMLALTLPGNFDYTATYTLFTGLASETGAFASVTGTNTTRVPAFTFTGGNYNLSFRVVPEPSTWAMGIFGLGMAAVWLRRRRVVGSGC